MTHNWDVLASPIDPRDQTSEVGDPAYRVCFWDSPGSCDEWELTEADIDEVLEWVRANGRGRPHSLWVVVRGEQDVQLVRLRGIDPAARPIHLVGLGDGSQGLTATVNGRGSRFGIRASIFRVSKMWWKSVDAFTADLPGANEARLREVRIGPSRCSSDAPGMGRNPRARRQFRQMRHAADSELDRRRLLWPDV